MDIKIFGKFVDSVKTFFATEKKAPDSDAKNTEIIVQTRAKIAEKYLTSSDEPNLSQSERAEARKNASIEMDKADVQNSEARRVNEAKSKRNSAIIGGGILAAIGALLAFLCGKRDAGSDSPQKLLDKFPKGRS